MSMVLTKKHSHYALVYSHLKNRKPSVRINNVYSTFLELISGIPQWSVLGALLLNIFLNDLHFFIEKASLHNYTDDNTLSAYLSDLNSLIDILTEESQTTINWLKANHMIINPKTFQAMLVTKRKNTIPEDLTISINYLNIKPNNSAKPLMNYFRQQTKFWKAYQFNLRISKLSVECTI